MKQALYTTLLLLSSLCYTSHLIGQVTFEPDYDIVSTEGYRSGVSTAIADVNGDGRDDLLRVTSRNVLEINFGSGNRTELMLEQFDASIPSEAWNITVGNLDNEGPNEIALGTVYKGGYVFTYNELDQKLELIQSTAKDFYSQGANFVDINNDGYLDWFICDDESENEIYLNDGNGHLMESDDFIDMATAIKSDNSGNYASDWIDIDSDGDLDFYISKCRSSAREATDPRRINQLFINDGNNNFTEEAEKFGIAFGTQTWATNFGDLDNDGDLDAIIVNHGDNWQLLENIENDTFIDRPEAINRLHGFAIQCILRDFDNNGYLDILVTGSSQYMWFNYGDFNFELVRNPFRFYTATNFAIGDINHDGFQDAYIAHTAGYNDPGQVDDLLYLNQTNENNWAGIRLVGKASNRNGIGARIRAYTPTHGWQIRDVRSGESYGIMNSLNSIFGLGTEDKIEKLEVQWPSGELDKFNDIKAGAYYTVTEGTCITEDESLIIENDGILCNDSSLKLEGKKSAHNIWSTGEDLELIDVSKDGIYTMTASTDDGCETKVAAVNVKMNSDVNYDDIIELREHVSCIGSEVQLSAQKGGSYLWSNGSTDQSIMADKSDLYVVNVTDLCGIDHVAQKELLILDPTPRNIVSDTVGKGATATLMAEGKNLKWYQSETEDKEIYEGDSINMTDVQESMTLFVQGEDYYEFESDSIGETEWIGTTRYADNDLNGGMFFEVKEDVIFESVEVYTDSIGEREFQIIDAENEVIFSKIINLEVGKNVLEFNIELPPGRKYFLTSNVQQNFKTFGFWGPRLQRSNSETKYPYRSSDMMWITNSGFGPQYLLYYYNWKIRKPALTCVSDRVPVSIVVDLNSSIAEQDFSKFNIYPNPVSSSFRIDNHTNIKLDYIEVFDMTGRPVLRVQEIKDSQIDVNISHLAAGTYSVLLSSLEGLGYVKRLIKVN